MSLICCIPGTTIAVIFPEDGFNEPLTVLDDSSASIASPCSFEIITAGIVIELSEPPIGMGSPEILFNMITAIAPASCAFLTFSTKVHAPLLIIAILPVASPPKELHDSVGKPELSFAIIKSAVITEVISGPKFVVGRDS